MGFSVSLEGAERNPLSGTARTRGAPAAEGTPPNAYIVVSLLTGARTEELRALTWAHVDLDGKPPTIMVWHSVRATGDTKTKKSLVFCALVRTELDLAAAVGLARRLGGAAVGRGQPQRQLTADGRQPGLVRFLPGGQPGRSLLRLGGGPRNITPLSLGPEPIGPLSSGPRENWSFIQFAS